MPPNRSVLASAAFLPTHKQMPKRLKNTAKHVLNNVLGLCGMAVLVLEGIIFTLPIDHLRHTNCDVFIFFGDKENETKETARVTG